MWKDLLWLGGFMIVCVSSIMLAISSVDYTGWSGVIGAGLFILIFMGISVAVEKK